MKKSFKTIMAFLTALTVVTGAFGATASAAENNETLLSESTATEGVFSECLCQ